MFFASFFIQPANAAETVTLRINDTVLNMWWWPYFFVTIKYFMISLTILLTVSIIFVVARAQRLLKVDFNAVVEKALKTSKTSREKLLKSWENIISKSESDNSQSYKEAVVLAEEFLDNILKIANFSGEDIVDRLKKIPDDQLEFKEDIIWAHKLKKRIMSGNEFEVDREEARRAVYIFQRVLKELRVI